MKHYKTELLLSAPADHVFRSLFERAGLQGWWTATCDVGTEVGTQSTFRFGQVVKVMRIEQLHPNSAVRWQCTENTLREWVGTHLLFRLESQSSSITLLTFEHIGLTPNLKCYSYCSPGWDQFLGSLKRYVETGKGSPYIETEALHLTGVLL